MKTFIRATAAAGLTAALMIASTAFAVALPSSLDFGTTAGEAFVDRVITISPETRSVGVAYNQRVKFVDSSTGQSFTWRFDTRNSGFDLNQIAPAGFSGASHVKAYVWGGNGQQG
jgi:hypothetical protein